MDEKPKITALKNEERDEILAAIETVRRLMPAQAEMAKIMFDELQDKGFSGDEALQLVAYRLFRDD